MLALPSLALTSRGLFETTIFVPSFLLPMNRKYIYPLIAIAIALAVFYYDSKLENDIQEQVYENAESVKTDTNTNFLPTSTTGQVVHHENYSLSYNEEHEQAEWVAYELKRSHLVNTNYKRPYFEIDRSVRTKAAHWKNYKKSGYTRGHLCPAGDRKFTKAAHDETFLTSNISPQTQEFNAGIWNRLENKVRYWAQRNDGVFVVTGGILQDGLNSIGEEEVSIPQQFYKVILDYNNGNPKMMAFLLDHKDSNLPLYEFVVPTDSIEKLTGIDFFPQLDDSIEDRLEASATYKQWNFN